MSIIKLTANSASTGPVLTENKTVQNKDRLIAPISLHYHKTVELATKATTANNPFLAGLQKAGYYGMAIIAFLAETFRNILAGLFDLGIAPINFVHGLVKSRQTETKTLEEKPAVIQAEETPVAEEGSVAVSLPRSTLQKLYDGVKYYTTAAANGITSKTSDAWNRIKAHPYKTAAVVGTTVALGVASYYGYGHFFNVAKTCPRPNPSIGFMDHVGTCPRPETCSAPKNPFMSAETCDIPA